MLYNGLLFGLSIESGANKKGDFSESKNTCDLLKVSL